MAFNALMHPRNLYKDNPPNFKDLAMKFPEFKKFCTVDLAGKVTIDFKNPESVRVLTRALLKNDFDLDIELPPDSLVPRIPLRLNYILWLQDIVEQISSNQGTDRAIWGFDIGTGASCIYPVLGAKIAGWRFVATERDADSVEVARRNVQSNGLSHLIEVVKVDEKTALCGVADTFPPERTFDFCMCNPPFYDVSGELTYCASAGRPGRPEPHSATIAKLTEVCAEGGEVCFISRIIDDSVKLGTRISVYTSMIGKKASLAPLKAKLREIKVFDMCVTTFSQGKTQRWALAWTFVDGLRLKPFSQMGSKKARGPLLYEIPSDAVHPYKYEVIIEKILNILDELQITHVEKEAVRRSAFSKFIRFLAEAKYNTWSHNRRKRRAMERMDKVPLIKRKVEGSEAIDACGTAQGAVVNEETSNDQKNATSDVKNGNGVSVSQHAMDEAGQAQTGSDVSKPTNVAASNTSSQKSILKFELIVKLWDTKIVLELHFLEGENQDALHQIFQFIKNRLH